MPRGINRHDEARLQGRLWTPRGDGLALWFDADDIGTITCDGSGNVSEWRNKSGNGVHASQGTAANRPTYQPGNVFGKPGVRFVASSSTNMQFTTLATADSTVCLAWRHTSSASIQTFISHTGSSGAHQCRVDSNRISQVKHFVAQIQLASSGASPPINHVWSWRTSSGGGTWLMRDDGTPYTASSTQAITLGQNVIGQSRGTEYFDGIMCEILVSSDKASDHALVRREGYLAWKWGFVDSLRGDHPFKNRPPMIGD